MKVCSLKSPNIPLPYKHKNPLYRSLAISAYFLLLTALIPSLNADDFGQGDLKFHKSFVPIASNDPSTNYFGESMPHTDYDYRISKTEISIAQFNQARAADPRISRSRVNFWNTGQTPFSTIADSLKFGVHAPVTYINIIECFKFCNWLTSGDPYQGAYKIIKNQNPENDFLDVKDYVDVTTALTKYSTVYTVPTFIE